MVNEKIENREENEQVSDEVLIGEYREGDQGAFTELYKRHKDIAFAVVFGMLRNKEDAEDTTQEVWRSVAKNLTNFKGESQFTTWLHAICRNISLNVLKKRQSRRFGHHDSINDNRDFTGEGLLPDELIDFKHPGKSVDSKTRIMLVRSAIESLSQDHRIALELVEQGIPQKEIAEMLGVKEGTIRSRVFYARKILQGLLGNE